MYLLLAFPYRQKDMDSRRRTLPGVRPFYFFLFFYVNDIAVVFYEKVSRRFWRIAIVTQVLPSRDS